MTATKFLVIYEYDHEEYGEPEITTAGHIFSKMDMSDCYDIDIASLYAIVGAAVIRCEFVGTHCCTETLRMEIRKADTGEVLAVGYGTDH